MKYFTALVALVATATAKEGDIFTGCYTDTNHPQGWRWVSWTDTYEADGDRIGTCDGSDTGVKQEWSLPASASESGSTNSIVIDFSSKGGPSDLTGTWDAPKEGILWSDGNVWPKTTDDWCHQTTQELEILNLAIQQALFYII